MLTQLDFQWFAHINQLADTCSFINPVMRFFAQNAEYIFYLGIVIYWFSRSSRNKKMVVEALLSASIAMGISSIISHLFYRDRPFVTHEVLQLIKHAANASFPSDHATAAFAIAASLWIFHRKSGRLWLILAACVAFSRVWTGVHYPSDVLAGALIGTSAAAGVHAIFSYSNLANKILMAGIQFYDTLVQRGLTNKNKSNSKNF